MIRFDGRECELVGSSGFMTAFLRAGKDGVRHLDWMIEGALTVKGGVGRGNFAGRKNLHFFLSTFGGTATHLDELPGREDERKERWEINKAVFMFPMEDEKTLVASRPGDFEGNMSIGHRFKIGPRKGLHFLVEGEAGFIPREEASELLFFGSPGSPDELRTVMQEFHVLEQMPLAVLYVAVPPDVTARMDVALEFAEAAGFYDLKPWPGEGPHHLTPDTPRSDEEPKGMVRFITPWAPQGEY